jgi:hypothetical protein
MGKISNIVIVVLMIMIGFRMAGLATGSSILNLILNQSGGISFSFKDLITNAILEFAAIGAIVAGAIILTKPDTATALKIGISSTIVVITVTDIVSVYNNLIPILSPVFGETYAFWIPGLLIFPMMVLLVLGIIEWIGGHD